MTMPLNTRHHPLVPDRIDPALELGQHPYVLQIEPVNRPIFRFAFHLGTNMFEARRFVEQIWHDYNNSPDFAQGVYTMALLQETRHGELRVVDAYDGATWMCDLPGWTYQNDTLADHEKAVARDMPAPDGWSVADTSHDNG